MGESIILLLGYKFLTCICRKKNLVITYSQHLGRWPKPFVRLGRWWWHIYRSINNRVVKSCSQLGHREIDIDLQILSPGATIIIAITMFYQINTCSCFSFIAIAVANYLVHACINYLVHACMYGLGGRRKVEEKQREDGKRQKI